MSAGGLSGDSYLVLLSLALAPLVEEVGFRLFLIGVPLFVVLMITMPQTGRALRALWRPSSAWEGVDEGTPEAFAIRPTKVLVYFLVALSAIVFGLAHWLSGAGWDIGKVSEAALDGVALAYLYVRYGLHASVIFHWALDFASNGYAFYGQAVYGVSWTANSAFSLVPAFAIVYAVGLPGLLYFVNLFFKRWMRRSRQPTTETGPTLSEPTG